MPECVLICEKMLSCGYHRYEGGIIGVGVRLVLGARLKRCVFRFVLLVLDVCSCGSSDM